MRHSWPELSYSTGHATYETLHLWTQIVGKIKITKMPWTNHSWHVTLRVTPLGFSTASLPDGQKSFQIDLDLHHHLLKVTTSTGEERSFTLTGLSVAGFYRAIQGALQELGIQASIHKMPNELEAPIPFDQDEQHATYFPEQATALHQAFLKSQEVLTQFRAGFSGKCSPVQLFWGSFDLAVSRFSGKRAPKHPGGVPHLPDWVAQEAYSHEVSSCGFWPGNAALPFAAFYSYIYPEPEGFPAASVLPHGAYYEQSLHEFILPYSVVQQNAHPSKTLLAFLNSTYVAAAEAAQWNRKDLETEFAS